MSVIFFLIPISVVFAAGFLAAFIWAVRSGQYEDTCTPSMRLLTEETVAKPAEAATPTTENSKRSAVIDLKNRK